MVTTHMPHLLILKFGILIIMHSIKKKDIYLPIEQTKENR